MIRHNDWMSYSYNDVQFGKKIHNDDVFKIHIKKENKILPLCYTEAIFNNARQIQDRFNQTQDVLLSGGIDSEVIVRTNKLLGIKQNIFTFRLEDGINARDVQYSIELCKSLGLKLNLIDFSLSKFIEQKAEALYKQTLLPIGYLVRTEWFNYLDNLPIVGNAEQYWRRVFAEDYSIKSKWYYNCIEGDFSFSIFSNFIGRPIIGEWYLYTPELMNSFHKTSIIKSILNDEVPGKISTWSSRYKIFQSIWPDISYKQKLTGYEGNNKPGSKPECMIEFEKNIMGYSKNKSIDILQDQFDAVISGDITISAI